MIQAHSSIGSSGEHVGQVNGRAEHGMVVGHALDLPTKVDLRFAIPVSVPAGSPKLRLLSLGHASKGTLAASVAWASVPAGTNPDTAVLASEGETILTWTDEVYLETKIPLDAGSISAGTTLVAILDFLPNSTIAVETLHQPSLIWE